MTPGVPGSCGISVTPGSSKSILGSVSPPGVKSPSGTGVGVGVGVGDGVGVGVSVGVGVGVEAGSVLDSLLPTEPTPDLSCAISIIDLLSSAFGRLISSLFTCMITYKVFVASSFCELTYSACFSFPAARNS